VAHRLHHSVDLAVSAFEERDFIPAVGTGTVDGLDERRLGATSLKAHSLPPFLERFVGEHPLDFDLIDLRVVFFRVREALREIAVVREKKRSLAVVVESADGEEAGQVRREEIEDGFSSLRITRRAERLPGLVHQEHHALTLVRPAQLFSIHVNFVPLGIGSGAELSNDLPIHGDVTVCDQFLCGSA